MSNPRLMYSSTAEQHGWWNTGPQYANLESPLTFTYQPGLVQLAFDWLAAHYSFINKYLMIKTNRPSDVKSKQCFSIVILWQLFLSSFSNRLLFPFSPPPLLLPSSRLLVSSSSHRGDPCGDHQMFQAVHFPTHSFMQYSSVDRNTTQCYTQHYT